MTEGHQFKNSSLDRNIQSDEQSSSLKFLGSDKEQEQNQADEDVKNISKRRPRDWVDNYADKGANGCKKKEKISEEEPSNNNVESTFLYKPGVEFPNLFNFTNQTIKVIISAEYVTRDNPAVLKRKIYGTDTYSANSDCVCIGVHYGLFNFNSFASRKYEGVQIIFKVIKPKKNYNGSIKNGIASQTIKNYNGSALKPESSRMLISLGPIECLQKYATNMRIPIGKARARQKPMRISSLTPLPETNFVFNMHNQPAFKYSIYNISDKGFQKGQFLIRKLDNKVLYFETKSKEKYQLSKYIQKTYFEAYRFAKVKNPMKFDNQYFSIHSAPLQNSDLEILQALVEWDEIIFSSQSIKIKETVIQDVASYKFHNMAEK